MNADSFFRALEASALSIWIREDLSLLALPGILTAHTLAMGFLAGTSLVIALRLLGFADTIPKPALARFFPVLWLAFWVNLATGILLVIGYPTKAMTNPLFYLKLAIIGSALSLIPRLRRAVTSADEGSERAARKTRLLAITSILLWAAAIVVGRLLPYTYHRLLVDG